jgi:Secretion system C-terminal sorting domain
MVLRTTYNVTGTDGNGCMNTASTMVTVNSLPIVSYSELSNLVCVYLPAFTLTPGSPAGGVYSGTAVTTDMFDPSTAGIGTYSITYTYTDGNSCTSSSSSSISVDACTGIAVNNAASSFDLYPNPATSEFTINVVSTSSITDKEITVEVYDILGNKVIQQKHTVVSGTSTLKTNIEQFNSGIYFVRLIDADNNVVYTQRVIKQ